MFMVRSFQWFHKVQMFLQVYSSLSDPSLDDYQAQEIYAENYFVTTSRKLQTQNPPKSINEKQPMNYEP